MAHSHLWNAEPNEFRWLASEILFVPEHQLCIQLCITVSSSSPLLLFIAKHAHPVLANPASRPACVCSLSIFILPYWAFMALFTAPDAFIVIIVFCKLSFVNWACVMDQDWESKILHISNCLRLFKIFKACFLNEGWRLFDLCKFFEYFAAGSLTGRFNYLTGIFCSIVIVGPDSCWFDSCRADHGSFVPYQSVRALKSL